MKYDEYGNEIVEGADPINFFITILNLAFNIFAYSPIWFSAFMVWQNIKKFIGESGIIQFLIYILIFYLIYCLIYFLKGVMIAFKVNNRPIWYLIFLFCVSFTCLIPAYISYGYLNDFFLKTASGEIKNLTVWTFLFSLIICILVYNKYKFLQDICPKFAFWAYSIGFNISLNFIKSPIDSKPDAGEYNF